MSPATHVGNLVLTVGWRILYLNKAKPIKQSLSGGNILHNMMALLDAAAPLTGSPPPYLPPFFFDAKQFPITPSVGKILSAVLTLIRYYFQVKI